MRNRNLLKRVLISTLIVIILFNFIIPTSVPLFNTVYAKTWTENDFTGENAQRLKDLEKKLIELAEERAKCGTNMGKEGEYDKKDAYKEAKKQDANKLTANSFVAEVAGTPGFEWLSINDKLGNNFWGSIKSNYTKTFETKFGDYYDNGKSEREQEEKEEEEWNNKTKLTEDELAILIADAKEAGKMAGSENGTGDGENGDRDNRSNFDLPDGSFGENYGFLPEGTELSRSDLNAIIKAYKEAFTANYDYAWNQGYSKYLEEGGEPIPGYQVEEVEDPNAPGPGNQGGGSGDSGGNGGSGGQGTITNPGTPGDRDDTNLETPEDGDNTNPENPENPSNPENPNDSENPGEGTNGENNDQAEGEDAVSERQDKLDALLNAHSNGPSTSIMAAIWNWIVSFFASIQELIFAVASSAGVNSEDVTTYITPLDIFFNKFTLLDINIFSNETGNGTQLETDGLVYKLRQNAAFWYYIFRIMAFGALLITFVINAIKALSSSSTIEQKTTAKKALKDWFSSFVLVLFMHILVIFIINVNNSLIKVIENVAGSVEVGGIMESLLEACFSSSFVLRCSSLLVYVLMIYQTVKYLLIYIQRFLTTFFLIVISPIIPVWHSTEKTIGNRSVALNGWLREFIFNVFLQLLHCIIYIVIVGAAMVALTSNPDEVIKLTDIGAAAFAVLALFFISHAERLLKNILGFNKAITVTNNVLQTAYTGTALAVSAAAGAAVGAVSGGSATAASSASAAVNTLAGVSPNNVTFGQNVEGNQQGNNTGNSVQNMIGNGVTHFKNFTGMVSNSMNSGSSDDNGVTAVLNSGLTGSGNGQNSNPSGQPVLKAVYGNNNNTSDEDNDTYNQKMAGLNGAVIATSQNTSEEHKEETETHEENVSKTEETEINNIIIGGNPAILEAFKKAFSKIQEDNKQFQTWGAEVNNRLDELDGLKDKLSNEEAEKIERDIDGMTSLEERKAYVESLGSDTLQGQYANKYADWKTYEELDDEIVNSKRNLINEYRGKGLQIDDNLASMLTTAEGAKLIEGLVAEGTEGEKVSAEENTETSEVDENISKLKEEIETRIKELEAQGLANSEAILELQLQSVNLDMLNTRNAINRYEEMKTEAEKAFKEARLKSDNVYDMAKTYATMLRNKYSDDEIMDKRAELKKAGFKEEDLTQIVNNANNNRKLSPNGIAVSSNFFQKTNDEAIVAQQNLEQVKKKVYKLQDSLKRLQDTKVKITTQIETTTTTTTTTVNETKVTGPTDSTNKVLEDLKNNSNVN